MSSMEEPQQDAPPASETNQPAPEVAAEPARSASVKRERKQAQVFKPEVAEKHEFVIKKGQGTKLADIPNVKFRLSKLKPDSEVLMALHNIVYKRPGTAHKRKRDVQEFSGLVYEGPKDKEKTQERLSKLSVSVINEMASLFDVPRGDGKKEQKVERLMEFLEEPKQMSTKDVAAQAEAKKKKKQQKTPARKVKTPAKRKKTGDDEEEEEDEDEDEEEEEKLPSKKRGQAPAASKSPAKKKKAGKKEEEEEEEGEEEEEEEEAEEAEEEEKPRKKRARAPTAQKAAAKPKDKKPAKKEEEEEEEEEGGEGKEEGEEEKEEAKEEEEKEEKEAEPAQKRARASKVDKGSEAEGAASTAEEGAPDAADMEQDEETPMPAPSEPKPSPEEEEKLWQAVVTELDKILKASAPDDLTIRKVMAALGSAVTCDPQWLNSKKAAVKEYMQSKLESPEDQVKPEEQVKDA